MITATTRRFLYLLGYVFYFFWGDKKRRKYLIIPIAILVIGFLIPQKMVIPVAGATVKDWDDNSFWAYPWGTSVTHKGIDIFKARGTAIKSSTDGIVLYTSEGGKGGKAVMILGPKWRFHYYAHLDEFKTRTFTPVYAGKTIGTLGDTGNAKGTPPHLHYSISTPFPYPHLFDGKAIHGWKKMFYLDPDVWLR